MDTSAQGLCDLNLRLRTDAAGMVSLWDECGRYCLTRKVQSLTANASQTSLDNTGFSPDQRLLNTTAVEANRVLAAGCVSWITPADTPWFMWKPAPMLDGSDAVETWLSRCTEIGQQYLAASNFYNRIHEVFLDRSTFGTACLWGEEGRNAPLNFRAFDVGSFVVSENDEGSVHLMFRELEYTAAQAKEAFGQVPPEVERDLEKTPNNKHRFLHALHERPADQVNPDGGPMQKRFASCYVHISTKTKVRESGYDELPAFVTRYLKWSESSPYGASPAMEALAEIRGVNYLELLLSTQAEVTVNPRVILPQGYQGTPDLRAGGLTFGGMSRDSHPTEWMTGGRIDWGLDFLARKERMIQEIFHRPLFDQFAQLERQITATEVRAREAEKLARFSPAFTMLTTEIINPVLERVFMILFRAGKFPPPPREAIVSGPDGSPMMLFPQVVQISRMALALQSLKRSAFENLLGYSLPLAQMGIPVMDNIDTDRAIRDLARGDGLPTSYLKDSEAVEATRAARAQAQAAAAQQEMVQQAMKSKPLVEAGMAAMGAQGAPA